MNRKGPWEGYRQALCCPLSPSRLLAKTKMAEVGKNPLPSGYEYEFISTVLDDHHCLICHLPLREPVLTRCGHRFCKNCLDEAIRRYENRTRILSLSLCWAIPFNIHTPAMDEMSLINPSEYSFYLRPLGNILFSLSTPRKI